MRSAFLLLLLTICVAGFAADVPLAPLGRPFDQTNMALAWGAPTSGLPRDLWVYRAVRSGTPGPVLSNLVALGLFTAKDRKTVPNYPHTISYDNPSGRRKLWIDPDWGYIYYRDLDADDLNIAEGVPDEKRAFQLATNLLPKLGISSALLARKPNSSDLLTQQIEATAMLWRRPGGGPPYRSE